MNEWTNQSINQSKHLWRNNFQIFLSCPLKGMDAINYTDNSKFLGIWLDKNLRWSIHTQKLANKSCKICFGIRVIRRVTGLETVRTLYYAYFQSLLSYGLIFWGNSINAKLIFRLQKRAIRAMMQIPKTASCKQHFKSLHILTTFTISVYIRNFSLHKIQFEWFHNQLRTTLI
jgi:hypothetical protein